MFTKNENLSVHQWKIALGSSNKIKLDAVKEGFSAAGLEVDVVGESVESNVSEQPYGEDETRRGAENRALNTQPYFPDADFVIGIESGLMEDNHDQAIICCLLKTEGYKTPHIYYSDKVKFNDECIELARERGFSECTVGEVMQERGLIADKKDPHISLTGKPRARYLAETITKFAEDILTNELASTVSMQK